MTATDLSEQTQRIASRIEAAKAALIVFCPGREIEAEALVRAFMEVLIEAMSSATVLASQAVLPAYAQATVAKERVDTLEQMVDDLRTLVREQSERLDTLEAQG